MINYLMIQWTQDLFKETTETPFAVGTKYCTPWVLSIVSQDSKVA